VPTCCVCPLSCLCRPCCVCAARVCWCWCCAACCATACPAAACLLRLPALWPRMRLCPADLCRTACPAAVPVSRALPSATRAACRDPAAQPLPYRRRSLSVAWPCRSSGSTSRPACSRSATRGRRYMRIPPAAAESLSGPCRSPPGRSPSPSRASGACSRCTRPSRWVARSPCGCPGTIT